MASKLAICVALGDAVNAATPNTEVSVGLFGDPASVVLRPESPAARAVVQGWDWSDAAQDARDAAKETDLQTLLDAAAGAVSDINTYLASADTATAAQVRAEVKAIDQRQKAIIKALVRVIRRTWK